MLEWFQNEFILKSAIAGAIVITGFIVGHFFSKAVGLAMRKAGVTEKMKQKGLPKPEVIVETSISYVIYAFAIIAALNRLGIFKEVFNILIVVALVILAIFLLLNLKDFILNAAAKILYKRTDLQVGRKIKINDICGEITKVGLTNVKIYTDRGNIMILPNAYLLKRKFKTFK